MIWARFKGLECLTKEQGAESLGCSSELSCTVTPKPKQGDGEVAKNTEGLDLEGLGDEKGQGSRERTENGQGEPTKGILDTDDTLAEDKTRARQHSEAWSPVWYG